MYTIKKDQFPNTSGDSSVSARGLIKAINSILSSQKGDKDFALNGDVKVGEILTAFAMSSINDLMVNEQEDVE